MSPTQDDPAITTNRPPSVDALAREIGPLCDLPHGLLVRSARQAIESHRVATQIPSNDEYVSSALNIARGLELALIQPVINATGVLLHTNLGRAPIAHHVNESSTPRATSLEFNLATGTRGSRQSGVSELICELTGAEDAVVVNNNAAAVLLVLSAIAEGRDVTIARGESVEIGGGFRIPDVLEQSGARLVDVGTTNRTRASDYAKAIAKRGNDVAAIMRIHPSNFHIEGFTEQAPLHELATLGVPVVVDIGSGLIDAQCPWLHGSPPQWLAKEPAARQSLAEGAALVTFSGDKLLGGPQCGIIAGSRELVAQCRAHPLMRALRPGSNILIALQDVLLSYVAKDVCNKVPFWTMATAASQDIESRAHAIANALAARCGLHIEVLALESLPGAGSTPGASIASFGISLHGDHTPALRARRLPIVARTDNKSTVFDLRSVDPADDVELVEALAAISVAN